MNESSSNIIEQFLLENYQEIYPVRVSLSYLSYEFQSCSSDSGTSGWYAVKPQVLFTLKTARAIAIMQVTLLKSNIIFFISVTSVWYFLEHSSSENTWTPSYLRISSLVSEKTEWLQKSLKPILKCSIPLYCGCPEAHWKWQTGNLLTKEQMRPSYSLTASFCLKAYSLLLSERER